MGTTSLFGTPPPVPNALVYIPSTALDPITDGAACGCVGSSGSPVATTISGTDGKFSLSLPQSAAGNDVKLVVQLGRWRRQVTVNIPACTSTVLPADDTRLPRTHNEGDIPLMAIATGANDAVECTLRKMGIDDSEFTIPSGGGRVQMYLGNNNHSGESDSGPGARAATGTTPGDAALWTTATVQNYDTILAPCMGGGIQQTSSSQSLLEQFANMGGRFFTSHFGYEWLFNNIPFNSTANWDIDFESFSSVTASVNASIFGGGLATWLNLVGALTNTTPPRMDLAIARHDIDSVNTMTSVPWLTATDTTGTGPSSTMVLQYTFGTPLGASPACGGVLFDDFHVVDGRFLDSTFPVECNPIAAMTNNELLFAYSLLNLECPQEQTLP
jgi:hypothetical protein